MLMFILGMSLCLNLLVIIGILLIFKFKKRKNVLEDIVIDKNVFSDFFKK